MLKILYIVSSWPNANGFGGQLRSIHIGRGLKRLGDVTVLYVGADARDDEAIETTTREFTLTSAIEPLIERNTGILKRLRWAFNGKYMNLHGYVASAKDQSRLNSLLSQFDLVWILNSRTPNILQRWAWPRSHLDIDDVPSLFLRSIAENDPNVRVRVKAQLERFFFARRERHLLNRFSTLSVCSASDREYLGGSSRIHVIPNGFQRPAAPPTRNVTRNAPRIGFIGLFSYAPNLQGIRWFVGNCWSDIKRAVPGIRLRLVGKGTDGPDRPDDPEIDGLGWVADPASEISTWSAMIVPIHFGGGTRIKLAEAFSRKVPVVSTTFGAGGYNVTDRVQLLIADHAKEFSNASVELVRNQALGVEIAENAWRDYLANWTWDAIYPKVETAAKACLEQDHRSIEDSM